MKARGDAVNYFNEKGKKFAALVQHATDDDRLALFYIDDSGRVQKRVDVVRDTDERKQPNGHCWTD